MSSGRSGRSIGSRWRRPHRLTWRISSRWSTARRRHVARERRGFTLIETLVALLVSSLVVLLAHQLFAGIAERGQTLISARATLDRDANARRWLRAAFLSLEVGTDSAGGFDARRAMPWCCGNRSRGWSSTICSSRGPTPAGYGNG